MKAGTKNNIKRIVVSSAFGCVFLFFLFHRLFVNTPGFAETASSYCVYPFLFIQRTVFVPLYDKISRNREYNVLQKQVEVFQKENEELRAKIIEYEATAYVYKEVKELVAFKNRYQTSYAYLAHVMAKTLTPYEQSFLVDIGSHHGVQKDMAAVYKNGVVGRVIEVYPYLSKIILITDRRCIISCYCSKTKTKGIFQGSGELECASLNHINRLSTIIVDELVISTGEGTVFPAGFCVGKVLSEEPDGMHLKVFVKPHIDVAELEYVYIIQKGAEPSVVL